jgi:hypothetical protein
MVATGGQVDARVGAVRGIAGLGAAGSDGAVTAERGTCPGVARCELKFP